MRQLAFTGEFVQLAIARGDESPALQVRHDGGQIVGRGFEAGRVTARECCVMQDLPFVIGERNHLPMRSMSMSDCDKCMSASEDRQRH